MSHSNCTSHIVRKVELTGLYNYIQLKRVTAADDKTMCLDCCEEKI